MLRQLISPVRGVLEKCCNGRSSRRLVGPCGESAISTLRLSAPWSWPGSAYHTSSVLHLGRKDRNLRFTRIEKKKSIVDGENSAFTEMQQDRFDDRYPDMQLPTKLFGGVMFKDLPILNVKASPNNTLMNVSDPAGLVHTMRSCGYDGFKNARKGTNVAAQATGFTFGKKLIQRGFRVVRARVSGLGPGRLSSLKGVTLAGVDIVYITDSTPVSWNPPRARKPRRL